MTVHFNTSIINIDFCIKLPAHKSEGSFEREIREHHVYQLISSNSVSVIVEKTLFSGL